jgi:uncharacterized cupin superfamily protein
MNRFGPALGAEQLAASIYEMPPGQAVCPYHYELPEEEWVIGLSGTVIVRHPEGEDELAPGEAVCFPPGPAGAHKITNRADGPARILMLSTKTRPNVAIYPDSDKLGTFDTGDDTADLLFRRDDATTYYDREP